MKLKVVISGGGTGGHIFPALAIAHEIRRRRLDAEVFFVGATGGMETTVVPKNGYAIQTVWISGLYRNLTLRNIGRNLLFPIKLLVSLIQSYAILNRIRPDCVIGVGGFASGPIGRVAAYKNIPLVLTEQNAYPGLVNKWLAGKAKKILLGNAAAQKFFPTDKTVVTGNPIRNFEQILKHQAAEMMGLDPTLPVVLLTGGSLGARTLNQAMEQGYETLRQSDIQVIWQCGKMYYDLLRPRVKIDTTVKLIPFIDNMAAAFAAADLVVSRAGGSTISEIIALRKPAILVPSPNVAEDHQTKNALSLVDVQAGILVKDAEAHEKLIPTITALIRDTAQLQLLRDNLKKLEQPNAAEKMVDEIFKLIHT